MSNGSRRFAPASDSIPAVILAAGKGVRMKARKPKAAVQVGGRPMVLRVTDAIRGAGISHIVAVVGHQADHVRGTMGNGVHYVVQEEQLGTGHAARHAEGAIAPYQGPLVVAYADIPLLTTQEVARLLARHSQVAPAATLLTAVFDEPGTLGRVIRAADGRVAGIVEAKDATEEQLAIKEVNVGVYCFQAPLLFEVLAEVSNDNAQHQYYLTDTIRILVRRGERVEAVLMERAHSGMGVDTRDDLARAQHYWTTEEAG